MRACLGPQNLLIPHFHSPTKKIKRNCTVCAHPPQNVYITFRLIFLKTFDPKILSLFATVLFTYLVSAEFTFFIFDSPHHAFSFFPAVHTIFFFISSSHSFLSLTYPSHLL